MSSSVPIRKIFFEIESDLEAVSLIGLSINRICIHLSFDTTDAYRIELAAVEALTNCIRHAYKNEPDKKISVSLEIFDEYILIKIRDQGEKFDHKYLKKGLDIDPNDPESLPVGGMGIHLILSIMDSVEVLWIDESNIWVLKKFFIKEGDDK